MPEMTPFEQGFCRSAPWRWFARRVVVPWALQGEQLSGDVLEIGSGSGAMAAELLARFPDIRLTATDYDDSMVEVARDRLGEFGERVEVQQADATQLPFDDESFDAVLSFIMLHHVMDWEKALAEAVRVLRPGGRLLGFDLLAGPAMRWVHAGHSSQHRMMQWDELRRETQDLPLLGVLNRSPGGFTVRFDLQKRELTRVGSTMHDAGE
jgi:ubiquinone/menaquinone biosynthesis C-methylase UbiE